VPVNKVWKVTSVFGQEVRVNECVNFSTGSTHEVGVRMKCSVGGTAEGSYRWTYFIRVIYLNGVAVPFFISGLKGSTGVSLYSSGNCTGSTYCCYDASGSC